EVATFQGEQREDEPAGERGQDERGDRQIQEAHEVAPVRSLSAVAELGYVQKVECEQPEEDQELRPLGRIAQEGSQVLEDEQPDGMGQEEEKPMHDRVQKQEAATASRGSSSLDPAVAAAVQVASHDGSRQVKQAGMGRQHHQMVPRLRPF